MSELSGKTGLILLLLSVLCVAGRAEEYDVLIRNGWVLDGTGGQAKQQDVAIKGDRIAAIGDLSGDNAGLLLMLPVLLLLPVSLMCIRTQLPD